MPTLSSDEREDVLNNRVNIDLEISPEKWVTLNVTYQERRAILAASFPEQRFVNPDGTIMISPYYRDNL